MILLLIFLCILNIVYFFISLQLLNKYKIAKKVCESYALDPHTIPKNPPRTVIRKGDK